MTVTNELIDSLLGISRQGEKEILPLLIAQSEGAKFWLQVVTDLKTVYGRLTPPSPHPVSA
jgi:putative transposase